MIKFKWIIYIFYYNYLLEKSIIYSISVNRTKIYYCIFRKHLNSKKNIAGCYKNSEKHLIDVCINHLYSSVTTHDRITEEQKEKLNLYKKDERKFLVKRCPQYKNSKVNRTLCCVNLNPIADFRKNDAGCCEEKKDDNFKDILRLGVYILSSCLCLIVIALLSMILVEKYPLFLVHLIAGRRLNLFNQSRPGPSNFTTGESLNQPPNPISPSSTIQQPLPLPVIRVPISISRPSSSLDDPPTYDVSLEPSPKHVLLQSSCNFSSE